MRERWAQDIDARARSYWTEARTRGLLGTKHLILPPSEYGPLLRAMGLLKADASMGPESVRKYMQISHMLTLIEPQIEELKRQNSEVFILDLACGNSYLTFTIATSLAHRLRHPGQVLGVDRNLRLIEACRERAWRLGLEDILRFEASNIEEVDVQKAWQRAFGKNVDGTVHLLLALHACDTATDEALALGISWNVPSMAVAPCCQGELAKTWAEGEFDDAFMPIRRWPHLRREVAATMTDALRALILEGCGYEANPIEFVPSAHTPKNTLLRANRRGQGSPESFREYVALRNALGGMSIHLERLLTEPHRSHLNALLMQRPH